jgi:hypothetical protein
MAALHPYVRRWDSRTQETHQAVAGWKLGRPLEPGEVVHHDDGNKRNNHPDNVWVFSSQRAHMLYEHCRAREARGIVHLLSVEEVMRVYGC